VLLSIKEQRTAIPANMPIPHPIMERTEASRDAQAAACPLRFFGCDVSSATLVVQNMTMNTDNMTFFTQFPLV
jgi:hypothetical protein